MSISKRVNFKSPIRWYSSSSYRFFDISHISNKLNKSCITYTFRGSSSYLVFLLFKFYDDLSQWHIHLPIIKPTINVLMLNKSNFKLKCSKIITDIFFSKTTVSNGKTMTSNINKSLTNSGVYYYLEYYFTLLLHGYLLRNRNRTFSLYPINHHNFLKGHSFSPSFDNIIKFRKFIFKSQVTNSAVPSFLFYKISKSFSSKLFFKRLIPVFCLYKNKFYLNVTKFINVINLSFVNRKSKHYRKLSSVKYILLKYFKKSFYKSNRLIVKKERYLKFLLKTKNFAKNQNFSAKIRLKKLSNFNGIYSKALNLAYPNNDNVAKGFFSKTKIRKHTNLTFTDIKSFFVTPEFNKLFLVLLFFKNSFLLKVLSLSSGLLLSNTQMSFNFFGKIKRICHFSNNNNFNIVPNNTFNFKIKKLLTSNNYNVFLKENLTPWVYSNVLRFIEFCSSKKVLLQLYSFMNQSINLEYITLYKRWIPRLSYYERRLGHRFFLEEALHILHIGFTLKDIKLVSSWLKAIIKRISFWKTRFIFRFIKYLFNNYFAFILKFLGVKGFKVKLKGKISVAGNSRKRSILYRVGKTSHSTIDVKVIHDLSLVNTFTGVMGLQTWMFY